MKTLRYICVLAVLSFALTGCSQEEYAVMAGRGRPQPVIIIVE